MICPNCNAAIADDSVFCSSCGKCLEPAEEQTLPADSVICPSCGYVNSSNANFCTNCRAPLTENTLEQVKTQNDLQLQQAQVKMQAMALQAQQEQLKIQQQQYNSMAKRPRCGSTSLSGNKKGFGIGKAVVGAALVGPLGLVAGNLGAKKVQVTCLNCGKKFKL